MKKFEIPQMKVVRFGKNDVLTASCPPVCECVDCLPCEEGNDCRYHDTCPTHCARDN